MNKKISLLKTLHNVYKKYKNIFKFIEASVLGLIIFMPTGHAEPTSTAVSISLIRTYSSGDTYITVSPSFCNTDTFHVSASDVGAKQMLAVIISAQTNRQTVFLEARNSTGCIGWGTQLQSIYLAAAP